MLSCLLAACSTDAPPAAPASSTPAPALDVPAPPAAPARPAADEDVTAPERAPEQAPEPRNEPERAAEQPREDPLDPENTGELDAGIKKIDETHYVLRRELLDRFLANPQDHRVRIVPAVENGNATGFKLFAIRPDSVPARLGLLNGDTVHAVNGTSIVTVDTAMEVFTKLRDASRIELGITRRGKSVVLVIDIEPAR